MKISLIVRLSGSSQSRVVLRTAAKLVFLDGFNLR
jgi:hypothetical protein